MIGMQDGDLTLEVEINGVVVRFAKPENIKLHENVLQAATFLSFRS